MNNIQSALELIEHPWITAARQESRQRILDDSDFCKTIAEALSSIESQSHNGYSSFTAMGNKLLDWNFYELSRQAYTCGFEKDNKSVIWNNLGFAYMKEGKEDIAVNYFRRSLQINPKYTLAINNLAASLIKIGLKYFDLDGKENLVAAEKFLFESLAVKPNHDWALLNLGNVWMRKGHVNKSILWYELAIEANENCITAHNNLGHAYLKLGDYVRGFEHYEWRSVSCRHPIKDINIPYWDGAENLDDKTILLHWEQGFGDMIHFSRYCFCLRKLYPKARIILETMPPLVPLLSQLADKSGFQRNLDAKCKTPPVNQVISNDRQQQSGMNIDFVYPLISLAKIFTIDESTIPRFSAYLGRPKPAKGYFDFLGNVRAQGKKLIGINWAGRPTHGNDKHRSIHLKVLRELVESPYFRDYQFLSFQLGDSRNQIAELGLQTRIIDISDRIKDFSDSAIILGELDWFISVDSAYLHLAGAMGVNAIGLIPARSDFRWLQDRTDSPWYPSIRLLRQKKELVWDGLAREIAGVIELAK